MGTGVIYTQKKIEDVDRIVLEGLWCWFMLAHSGVFLQSAVGMLFFSATGSLLCFNGQLFAFNVEGYLLVRYDWKQF